MTKPSETDMTRLIGGTKNTKAPPQALTPSHQKILDEIAPVTPEQWKYLLAAAPKLSAGDVLNLAATPVNYNPNRVRCPLCRRINTVSLVNANAGKPSDFRCSYDGCRGYEWAE